MASGRIASAMPSSTSTSAPRRPAVRSGRKPGKASKALKLNREKVLELSKSGLCVSDIARHQGVYPSTVWRFLDKQSEAHRELEAFKSNRANVFADLQHKAIRLQNDLLDSFYVNGVLVPLAPQQKTGLVMALNAVSGTIYDKERLELGKSTQNVGLIARMMGSALGEAHKAEAIEGETTPNEGQR